MKRKNKKKKKKKKEKEKDKKILKAKMESDDKKSLEEFLDEF